MRTKSDKYLKPLIEMEAEKLTMMNSSGESEDP